MRKLFFGCYLEAFMQFILYLKKNQTEQKQVIFIDELSRHLSARKLGFLKGLSFFLELMGS